MDIGGDYTHHGSEQAVPSCDFPISNCQAFRQVQGTGGRSEHDPIGVTDWTGSLQLEDIATDESSLLTGTVSWFVSSSSSQYRFCWRTWKLHYRQVWQLEKVGIPLPVLAPRLGSFATSWSGVRSGRKRRLSQIEH